MQKYQKKKKHTGALIVVWLLILAVIAGIGYFGYQYYIRETHPIGYGSYVEKYAAEYGIDKYLVYAVIKTESSYDHRAVSNVGARGLMQIMEDTFDWIKFRMGDEETEYSDMFDPEVNIRYGCFLLGFLYEEFGNIDAAMAAYHAGRGAVNGWLSDSEYSRDGVHLDKIPIRDTAHYVDKINAAMQTYIRLYDQ
ncbi:MAG: lytic transglycosylase domain-containing protein [Oscillospiraceae bacterium]|nr:lytic transglycosylase domain-containing protein [Oscillospiraceae bacterium]